MNAFVQSQLRILLEAQQESVNASRAQSARILLRWLDEKPIPLIDSKAAVEGMRIVASRCVTLLRIVSEIKEYSSEAHTIEEKLMGALPFLTEVKHGA